MANNHVGPHFGPSFQRSRHALAMKQVTLRNAHPKSVGARHRLRRVEVGDILDDTVAPPRIGRDEGHAMFLRARQPVHHGTKLRWQALVDKKHVHNLEACDAISAVVAMRILWLSDDPAWPTGFGNITRAVCSGLTRF